MEAQNKTRNIFGDILPIKKKGEEQGNISRDIDILEKQKNQKITLIELTNGYNDNMKIYMSKYKRNNKFEDIDVKENYIRELELYNKKSKQCDDISKIYYKNIYPLVDYETLLEYVNNRFYDINVMSIASCIISLLTSYKYTLEKVIKPVFLYQEKQYHQYLMFSKLLGTDESMIVFKNDYNYDILHEGLVGLYVINKMRRILPTYVWTYGFTSCNLPIYKKDKMVLTACNKETKFREIEIGDDIKNIENKEYIGLITERINGIGLREYIQNRKYRDDAIYRIILIVIISLKYAYENFKFVHWDLHIGNIMMRKSDKRYIKTGGNTYIKIPEGEDGDYIPTIFDFGLSSFEIDKKVYGNYSQQNIAIIPENGTSYTDVVKFLYSMRFHFEMNSNVKNVIDEILRLIFNEPREVINILNANYYVMPNMERLKGYRFTDFIKDTYKIMMKYTKGMNLFLNGDDIDKNDIISCEYNMCESIKKIEADIFNREYINSIYDLSLLNKDRFDINKVIEYINEYIKIIPDINIDTELEDIVSGEQLIMRTIEIKNIIEEIDMTIEQLKRLDEIKFIEYIDELNNISDKIYGVYKYLYDKFTKRDFLIRKESKYKKPYDIIKTDIINNELEEIIGNELEKDIRIGNNTYNID